MYSGCATSPKVCWAPTTPRTHVDTTTPCGLQPCRLGHSQYSLPTEVLPGAIWSTRWRTSVLHVKNIWRRSRGRLRRLFEAPAGIAVSFR
ncbi:hypothetical protein UPYG_G00246700 [Umbra pygmaea]|uniref:Uncharacterized protein n=1 Tax=Umbra pygmaea TaxID=75934 RepID=A0ABD0WLR2_UMBPY